MAFSLVKKKFLEKEKNQELYSIRYNLMVMGGRAEREREMRVGMWA